ncbi:ribosomal-processing cysteine protease Prp [Oceanirhabdus sp. W0125-5]|uniref:ribosomal-processing cysteine protease Prp n=1 Tax=Oceanirhabdus sp. W0125-5 TaxID=2999116 RepID=UPI0022F33021|nr:ribosomal-processing cysteine protease Prp [Oceanirhabdus sp. W0125-5]WBW98360.1 ribosomal-processing cysteine protease Prp [Oceanirhabdus sp. W0125-5]
MKTQSRKITEIIKGIFSGGTKDVEKNLIASEGIFKQIPIVEKRDLNNVKRINVIVSENKDGIIYGITVSGESKYDEAGKDIFNAAISILSQNMVGSLRNFTDDKVEFEMEKNYVRCILPNMKKGQGSNEAAILIKSALFGMISLQDSYGDENIIIQKVIE